MDEAIYPITANTNSPITANGIGWCDYQYHCVRKEGYPIPQINFCTGGSGVLIADGKTTEITTGMSFFLPQDQPHEYYTTGNQWHLRWVTFSGSGCSHLLEQFGLNNAAVIKHSDSSGIDSAWQEMYNILKRGSENDALLANAVMYRYLTEYYISKINSESTASEQSAFGLASEFISAHFTEEITINDISDAAGVSPQYLCRIFRRRTELRPFQYIALRRIQYAKQLLGRGGMTIAEISRKCGYNDVSYFCKLFKRQEGVSPKKFMSV